MNSFGGKPTAGTLRFESVPPERSAPEAADPSRVSFRVELSSLSLLGRPSAHPWGSDHGTFRVPLSRWVALIAGGHLCSLRANARKLPPGALQMPPSAGEEAAHENEPPPRSLVVTAMTVNTI